MRARARIWATATLFLLAAGCASSRAEPVSPGRGTGGDPTDWMVIGDSIEGRSITAVTVGGGRQRVYVIAGIHGDERSGGENVERLVELFRRSDAADLATIRVVRDVNPDGTAVGSRTNSRGVDLNRNWPADNFRPSRGRGSAPLSEPEVAAAHADLVAFNANLVIVFHEARTGPFVNYDGPASILAARFATAAALVDPRWHVRRDMGYPTPGSLGSLVGVEWGVPILTVEFRRDRDPDEAWPALRNGITALLGVEDYPVVEARATGANVNGPR